MTDRPTETLRAIMLSVADAARIAYQNGAIDAPHIFSVVQAECERLCYHAAHSGEEPQTTHESRGREWRLGVCCEDGFNARDAGATGSIPGDSQPLSVVTASPAKTGDDLERDGTFAIIAEALGEPSAAPVEPLEDDEPIIRCHVHTAACGDIQMFTATCGFIGPWKTGEIAAHEPLREALRKLANEASGFLAMADIRQHGRINEAVLQLRIDEARAALREHPVAVETPKVRVKCPWCGAMCAQRWCGRCERMLPYEAFNELSSDPRQIEPPSGGPNDQ